MRSNAGFFPSLIAFLSISTCKFQPLVLPELSPAIVEDITEFALAISPSFSPALTCSLPPQSTKMGPRMSMPSSQQAPRYPLMVRASPPRVKSPPASSLVRDRPIPRLPRLSNLRGQRLAEVITINTRYLTISSPSLSQVRNSPPICTLSPPQSPFRYGRPSRHFLASPPPPPPPHHCILSNRAHRRRTFR